LKEVSEPPLAEIRRNVPRKVISACVLWCYILLSISYYPLPETGY